MPFTMAQPVIAPTQPYFQDMLRGKDHPEKDRTRKLVLAHFEKHQNRLANGRLLTLPGCRWVFERRFLQTFPWMDVLAFEKNSAIFDAGVKKMPGKHKPFGYDMRHTTLFGEANKHIRYVRTTLDEYLWFCRYKRGGAFHLDWWNREFENVTCFWLDFCGFVTEALRQDLKRVHIPLASSVELVPFAVTIMNGRRLPKEFPLKDYTGSAVNRRVDFIADSLQHRKWNVRITDVKPYMSGPIQMLLVMGLMRRPAPKLLTDDWLS